VIGAGTWADAVCAVSATGVGEYFIRAAAAHQIAARLRYRGETLHSAAGNVVAEIEAAGGEGGVIAVDRTGLATLPFKGTGMYRGVIGPNGQALTALFHEDLCPTGAAT
jgi:beta-aspartyl-peptidase (threonine type)